ncbi:MAG: glycosyltransferase family 39 protein [Candidatus Electryonea clarkiae]|nr:glycosyltransferase family 39 protein [Candidatus Electryonea clarkiae]MDP8287821.1 glycosyltransferase family 39 protein [Candidatus Electryonea clarkiae]
MMINHQTLSRHISTRIEIISLAILILWLMLIQFYQWPVLVNGGFDNRDCAAYVFAGEIIRDGGVPYVDFWDQKPPLIYLINAAALEISNGNLWSVWVTSLLCLITTLLIGHFTIRRWLGNGAALIGSILFASSFIGVYAGGNLTESYALPFQWALLLIFITWLQKNSSNNLRTGLLTGILTALCFILRQNLIGTGLAVAITSLIIIIFNPKIFGKDNSSISKNSLPLPSETIFKILKYCFGGILGVLVVFLPVLIYLLKTGSLAEFYECAFNYNFSYKTDTDFFKRIYIHLPIFDYIPITVLAVLLWIANLRQVIVRLKCRNLNAVNILLFTWFPIEFFMAIVSGQSFNHYYLTLLPVVIALIVYGSKEIITNSGISSRFKQSWIILVLLVISFTVIKHNGKIIRSTDNERVNQVSETVDYIKQNTNEDDTIFVWGVMADVYFLSGRKPASRYTLVYPLLAPGYTKTIHIQDLLRDLEKSSPKLIVDASPRNRNIPVLDYWDSDADVNGGKIHPALEQFYNLLQKEYKVSAKVGDWNWQVWVRKKKNSIPL